MSNNTGIEACAVLLKTKRASKCACQHIEACVEVCERHRTPYNDRTAVFIKYNYIQILFLIFTVTICTNIRDFDPLSNYQHDFFA